MFALRKLIRSGRLRSLALSIALAIILQGTVISFAIACSFSQQDAAINGDTLEMPASAHHGMAHHSMAEHHSSEYAEVNDSQPLGGIDCEQLHDCCTGNGVSELAVPAGLIDFFDPRLQRYQLVTQIPPAGLYLFGLERPPKYEISLS